MPTLLITGANRGLGLEICKQYLEDNWIVHATCRDANNATRLNALKTRYNKLLTIHELEVSNFEQVTALHKELQDTTIDVLLNNAGVFGSESSQFGKSNAKAWQKVMSINAIAPLQMIEMFVDNVARSKRKIIASMSSKMGSLADNSSGGSYAYRSSKAALNAVMVSVSHDLKDMSITVLILHPGWVRTDMGGPNGELSVEESATRLRRSINNSCFKDSGTFFDIDGTVIPW